MPWGGARGQNLEHLRIFYAFIFQLWNHLYLNIRYYYRVDFLSVTSDYRVQCPRVGLALGVKI